MKKSAIILLVACAVFSCNNPAKTTKASTASLDTILSNYWQERMQLFPLEATANGDNRYNDRLTITIAGSFRDSLGRFYKKYLSQTEDVDTSLLNDNEMMSYRIFRYEMNMGIEGLKYPSHYLPINQFWSLTLDMPQLGSGTGNQPFKTLQDYNNWLLRLSAFPAWADTAVYNMRQGIAAHWVLPKTLVTKVMTELKNVIVENDTTSIFYGPVKSMPASFTEEERMTVTGKYKEAIEKIVNPTYARLYAFFKDEYLPHATDSSGISSLPGGRAYYDYLISYWTTTSLPADSIYNIGLREVARFEAEMDKVKNETGFKGDQQAFFKYLATDKRFFPFTTPKQVIDSFWGIKKAEDPQLAKLFNHTPKTGFTIRQTEDFRAASASAEYNQGSADGTRPGIFYVPILNAAKYNCTGMATLFLHEAIPGHHYQISLQQENKDLPDFRRFLWYGAYGEGWAHYCETLGKELGVYNDPYQYFGHLSDGILRAVRLVVDIGIHTRGMTREEAIVYMRSHILISEEDATSEIERYMAIPGQALSYKIGQMAISGERKHYEDALGAKFNIAYFHNQVLKDGCVPLSILHQKLAVWAQKGAGE